MRASWFNQNFSEGYLLDGVLARRDRVARWCCVPEPFIDADDIADVVGGRADRRASRRRVYEVTGPRALTFAEATTEIAASLGRPIRYTQIAPTISSSACAPTRRKTSCSCMNELFTVVLDGRNCQAVVPGVQHALGRPARDFSDYVRRTVASGVWTI